MKRAIIEQYFKPWSNYEKALFEFLLEGKAEIKLDFLPLLTSIKARPEEVRHFETEYFEGEDPVINKLMASISKRFTKKFKADITNGREVLKNSGFPPHLLRHARVYSLKVHGGSDGKGLSNPILQRTAGYSSEEMIGYYSDVRRAMGKEDILEQLASA